MYHCAEKKLKSTSRGFTLIELMVSVALFAVVLTLSVGTLLALVDANRKAESLKSVINNLNFGIESMTRTLRTGDTYYCDDDVSAMPEGTLECPDGAIGITFTDDQGVLVGYRFEDTQIERRTVDGVDDSGWIALTAPEVVINDMLFYTSGNDEADNVQPTITISIRGTAGTDTDTDSSFSVQSTVAQRTLTDAVTSSGTGGGGGADGYELFSASDTFIAPQAGTYRIFAIGGGGGGDDDEGAGGGSGYVAYTTAILAADESVTITIGAGGARGASGGSAGGDTSFGGYLTANGGEGGTGSNTPGGAGGSGGAGDPNATGVSQTGGSGGTDGTDSGAGGGAGQGSSFTTNYTDITSVTLTSGAGGTTQTGNGEGGGGGGGVVVDGDTSVKASNNQADTANGGVGYGAGGAGGDGNSGARFGSNGRAGMLVVEWD